MTKYRLASCIPLDGLCGPGFQLPIFTGDDRQGIFVQICSERGERVEGFTLFATPPEGIIDLENGAMVNVGDAPIFAFLQDDGVVLWGTKSQLASRLRSTNLGHAHALQMAELFGNSLEKFKARETTLRAYGGSKIPTQALLASVFAQATWDNLISLSVSDSAIMELRSYRRLVMLHSNPEIENVIPDEIWTSISPLVSINRAELRKRLVDEIPEIYSEEKNESRIFNESKYYGLINIVTYIKRQEERSAFLLEKLLEDPDVARYLVDNYRDRAQLARAVWKEVKESIDHLSAHSHREQFVAGMVQRLFSMSYPFTRGETLYYLAKRLGKYPLVARAIQRKAEASHSFNVNQWRNHILQQLDLQ